MNIRNLRLKKIEIVLLVISLAILAIGISSYFGLPGNTSSSAYTPIGRS